MKLIAILLLINLIHSLGDNFGYRLTKIQLRCMHKKELERVMNGWFIKTFNIIFNDIIETAKQGKDKYEFTIVKGSNCKDVGRYIQLPEINSHHINMTKYTINLNKSLRTTFLDSNFTINDDFFCQKYTIQW